MRAPLLAILLLVPLFAGCTGNPDMPDPASPAVSAISGVTPDDEGALNLTAGSGLDLTTGEAAIQLALAQDVEARSLLACHALCPDLALAPGVVGAEAGLISLGNLTLVATAPQGDSTIFFDDPTGNAEPFFRWSTSQGRFQVNGDLMSGGNLTSTGFVGTITPIVLDTNPPQIVTITTAATEGTEATVFLRGSGRMLSDGARIDYPPEFAALVGTGPITVQVTPTSKGAPLYVAEKTPTFFRVDALGDIVIGATFDYFVQASRRGMEGFEV